MLCITFLQKFIAVWFSNPFEVCGSLSVLQQARVCLPASLQATVKQKFIPEATGASLGIFFKVSRNLQDSPQNMHPEAVAWPEVLLSGSERECSVGHILGTCGHGP